MTVATRRAAAVAAALASVLFAPSPAAARGGGNGGAAAPAAAADDAPALPTRESAEERFYRAWYRENATREFREAETAYAEAASMAETAGETALRVRALAGRARCLLALGRADEARAAADAALAIDASSAEALAVRDALAAPEGPDPELAAHVMALVRRLDGSGDERNAARDDLVRVGAPAVPFLATALRSRAVGLVDGAAYALAAMAAMETESARVALATAIADPGVAFPRVVGDAIAIHPFADTRVASAMFESGDLAMVRAALQPMRDIGYPSGQRDAGLELIARGLRHSDQVVRSLAMTCATNAPAGDATALAEPWSAALASVDASALPAALRAANPSLLRASAPALRALLTHEDRGVRDTAQGRLLKEGVLEDAEAEREVLAALESGDIVRFNRAWVEALQNAGVPWTSARCAALVRGLSRLDGRISERLEFVAWIARDSRARELTVPQIATIWDTVARWSAEGAAATAGTIPAAGAAINGPTAAYLMSVLTKSRDREWTVAAIAELLGYVQSPLAKRALLQQAERANLSLPASAAVPFARADDAEFRWLGYGILGRHPRPALAAVGIGSAADLPHLAADVESTLPPPPESRQDGAEDLGGRALRVLHVLGDPAAAPALRRVVTSDRVAADRRARALEVLVACVGQEALPDLRAILAGEEWSLAHPHMWALLKDEYVGDLVAVARRLGDAFTPLRVPRSSPRNLPTMDLVLHGEALGRYLRDLGAVPATGAGEPVGPALPPYAVATVLDHLGTASPAAVLVRWCASPSRPDCHDEAVKYAVRVLGSAAAPEVLLPLLDSGNLEARAAAGQELHTLRNASNLRSDFGRWLEGEGMDARDSAARLLEDKDPVKRQGAALALAALGDPAAIPALLKLLDDADKDVRDAALRALDRLGAARAGEKPR